MCKIKKIMTFKLKLSGPNIILACQQRESIFPYRSSGSSINSFFDSQLRLFVVTRYTRLSSVNGLLLNVTLLNLYFRESAHWNKPANLSSTKVIDADTEKNHTNYQWRCLLLNSMGIFAVTKIYIHISCLY